MNFQKLWKPLLIVGMVIIVTAGATVVFLPGAVSAARGGPGMRGWFGQGNSIDREALLAEALGITVDQLQTAQENARAAAIQQAADNGLITQEQADEMILWGRGFLGGPAHPALADKMNNDTLLADALGITVDKLHQAQQQANANAIQQALDQGMITQAQADQMWAANTLRGYLDHDTLLAEALGISVESLRTGQSQGKTLTDFLNEQNLDAATARQNLLSAREKAIQQAISDGVITQDQVDQMQNRGFKYFEGGFGPGPDGPGGGHFGRGGFGPANGGRPGFGPNFGPGHAPGGRPN